MDTRLPKLLAIVALAIGVTACEGNQGPAGPPGAAGPVGTSGTSTSAAVPVESAKTIRAQITGVTVAADTRATVQLSLKNEIDQPLKGLRAENLRFVIAQLRPGVGGRGAEWHAYTTRRDGPAVQATTEPASVANAVFKDNNDGTYEYIFAKALDAYGPDGASYDATLTHRVGLELRSTATSALAAANNSPYTFQPSSGSTTNLPTQRDIVDNDTCFACHDRLEFHGGPRTDVQYCVTCHNPGSTDGQTGNTVSFPVLIHKIHMGANLANGFQIIGNNNTVFDFSNVHFPQDQRNCQTCHQESDADTPQASNWRNLPYSTPCGACHDTVNFQTGEGHGADNLAASDDQCVTCHGPASTINNGNLRVEVVHRIPTKLAGQRFKYNILGVTNTAPGQSPVVRFSVTDPTNNNAPYNILTDPAFTAGGGASSLSVNIGWNTANYTNAGSGSATPGTGTPAQPIRINPLTIGGTPAAGPDAEGAFAATSPLAIPPGVMGSLGVALEGHPALDADGDGVIDRIPVTNAIAFAAATGPLAPRRQVVDVRKCNDCHNQLSMHGSNRTDEVQVCAMCHNPNTTDINRRVPNSTCVNTLGADDSPTDLKYMIHAIHNGPNSGYAACGFGNTPILFDEVHFPGKLNNCEACHVTPTATGVASYYPVDPDRVLATTVDAGPDRSSQTDDVAWSPNVAVCSGCHLTAFAEAHMLQNGGSKSLTKNADGTTAGGPLETCGLCHGPGRVADVKVMHGVGNFEFQAPVAP